MQMYNSQYKIYLIYYIYHIRITGFSLTLKPDTTYVLTIYQNYQGIVFDGKTVEEILQSEIAIPLLRLKMGTDYIYRVEYNRNLDKQYQSIEIN